MPFFPAGQNPEFENLSTAFNAFAGQRYNKERPFILVHAESLKETRGDFHGHCGVARVLAERTGGRMEVIDSDILYERYYAEHFPDRRLGHYFKDEGYPDFYFSTNHDRAAMDILLKQEGAKGVIISTFNERMPASLIPGWYEDIHLIPHHLTPEILAREGARFIETFSDLPRPFIGVNLASYNPYKPHSLKDYAETLTEMAMASTQATLFIVSSHRTKDNHYNELMAALEENFRNREDCLRIVGFNLNHNRHKEDSWNPYKGMLHAADCIVQIGHSGSMLSEALFAGKQPYCSFQEAPPSAFKKGYVRQLFEREAGVTCMSSEPFAVPDVTALCALGLLKKHRALLKSLEGSPPRKAYEREVFLPGL